MYAGQNPNYFANMNDPYNIPNQQQPVPMNLNFNNANPQMFNQFGGLQRFQNNFNNFANNFKNTMSMSPQQMVQQKLDSGQMSPQQFAELRRIANAMTGMNF